MDLSTLTKELKLSLQLFEGATAEREDISFSIGPSRDIKSLNPLISIPICYRPIGLQRGFTSPGHLGLEPLPVIPAYGYIRTEVNSHVAMLTSETEVSSTNRELPHPLDLIKSALVLRVLVLVFPLL
jgi:hypothetical protein